MFKELESNFFVLVKTNKNRAFKMIFDAYWETLYKQAFKKIQDEAIAKDLVQDVFTSFWDKIEFLDAEKSILAYLYAILRNKVLKLYVKDEVRLRYANNLAQQSINVDNRSQHLILEKELKAIIDDEIFKMPPRMSAIYSLKKDDERSIKQIAEDLSLSEQTIKNQLQLAYQRLRVRVKDYDSSLAILAYLLPIIFMNMFSNA